MRCLITNEPWDGPGPYSLEGLRRLDRRLKHWLRCPIPATSCSKKRRSRREDVRSRHAAEGQQRAARHRGPDGRRGQRWTLHCEATAPRRRRPPGKRGAHDVAGVHVEHRGACTTAFCSTPTGTAFLFLSARFDRTGWTSARWKISRRLTGGVRDTKYNSSTERLIEVINRYSHVPGAGGG